MKKTRNRYIALRHATSLANEEGLVVSDPANGIDNYGLSEKGHSQAREAFAELSGPFLASETVCYSSDFKRARETAQIFCEAAGLAAPVLDKRLRERFFGDFELQSHENYHKIWQQDSENARFPDGFHRVETVYHVMDRLQSLVDDCEERHDGLTIIFSSHGDTLQIAQCLFSATDPARHRSLPHLENAELRDLSR